MTRREVENRGICRTKRSEFRTERYIECSETFIPIYIHASFHNFDKILTIEIFYRL